MTTRTFPTMALVVVAATLCAVHRPALARQGSLPWLHNVDANGNRGRIHTIAAEASVTVSDGLTFSVQTVFHDRQRAIFRRLYADRTITEGVEGRYIWSFDGEAESEVAPSDRSLVEEIVLGHQFQAQLLFFDQLHRIADPPTVSRFAGEECMAISSEHEGSTRSLHYRDGGLPLGMSMLRVGQADVLFEFDDWRSVDGVLLPFSVDIDDGDRTFQYRYGTIKVNDGSLADLRAPYHLLTEEQKLLRLHRSAMDDHFFGRTVEMKASRADSLVIVSDGDIYSIGGDEFDAMMDGVMQSRNYTAYDDLMRPEVKISDDGTLGWVVVQVSARGVRFNSEGAPAGPLKFVSAWIELYEKIDGRWRLTGNVSNFQPDRQ